MFYISSDRLRVGVDFAGEAYRRSRFDWSGIVRSVILDGRHRFCAPESYAPGRGSGGEGIMCEFGRHGQLGFAEAPVGGWFARPGIGLLLKGEAGPFNCFMDCDTRPFAVSLDIAGDSARFEAMPMECGGFAFSTARELKVAGNELSIKATLRNLGERDISTDEYAHNFFCVDGRPIGGDYELRAGYPMAVPDHPIICAGDGGRRLKLRGANWGGDFYARIEPPPTLAGHEWTLTYVPSGAGVSERDDFRPLYFAVWAVGHAFCPEVLADIRVPVGGEAAWTRVYTFFGGGGK